MHACGHDIHMTVCLGILSYFAEHQPKCDMTFIFQPAEENASGGKQLYESGALDEWMPDEIYAFHDNPQLPAGAIGCCMGTLLPEPAKFMPSSSERADTLHFRILQTIWSFAALSS